MHMKLVLFLCMGLLLAACSGESDDQIDSVPNFIEDVAQEDYDGACERLSDRARQDLGDDCEEFISALFAEEQTQPAAAPTDVPSPIEPTDPTETSGAAGDDVSDDDLGTMDKPVPLGVSFELGDGWLVTVVSVNPDATAAVLQENEFNDSPEEGNVFFIASLQATYQGESSATLDASFRFRVVGDSAVAYSTFDNTCGVVPNEIPSAETFPGGTLSGDICWEVPASDVGTLLMFDDPFAFDAERVYFSLTS